MLFAVEIFISPFVFTLWLSFSNAMSAIRFCVLVIAVACLSSATMPGSESGPVLTPGVCDSDGRIGCEQYNADIDWYKAEVKRYKSAIDLYQSAVKGYESAVHEYQSAIKLYQSAIDTYQSIVGPKADGKKSKADISQESAP